MKIKSVILARGGSKGIPKKNIKTINGKPLLWYTANASLNSSVDETWVSTDCPEIKKVAEDIGCSVIDRPAEISSDYSKSDTALVHFAKHVDFDVLVFIQPTSPLLESQDIDKGLSMMNEYDSVFSAHREHWIPKWSLNGYPIEWDINNRPMRQDIEETYVENGAFYIFNKKNFLKYQNRLHGKIGTYIMPEKRSIDIDEYEDLKLVKESLKKK